MDSEVIDRITYWKNRADKDNLKVSVLDECILESQKDTDNLIDLRKQTKEYLEKAEERLDYWLQRYEKDSE